MGILKTKALCKNFGRLRAVHMVDLEVEEGEVCSIIGPNGAGKTTLFNLLSGHLVPSSGTIFFRDRLINGLKPFRTSHLGIGRSFQLNNLFPNLTVFENVRLAVQSRSPARFNLMSPLDRYREINDAAESVLERIGLTHLAKRSPQTLSHGDKRLLEIGIALATAPALLLLDEPTSGMAPEETVRMIDFIKKLSQKLTIVLIEHKMTVVMTISDRVTVMHQGSVIASGTPDAIREDAEVRRAYLGGLSHVEC